MKKILLGLLLVFAFVFAVLALAAGGGWLVYRGGRQQAEIVKEADYQRLKSRFEEMLAKADSLEKLEELGKTIRSLNDGDRQKLRPVLELKFAEQYYWLAEEKIWRARQIAGLLEARDTSPLVEKYLNDGFDYYRKAKELIDSLMEVDGDTDYNFHLHYARGNIYYRVLMFLANQDEAPEIFNQTAMAWETALDFKEKDVSTEINLEVLYKKREELAGMASRGRGERLRVLPYLPDKQQGIGGGRPHGNF